MNKNVIYVEPGDDITDILTKIENSKEKIVALVPPKKAGVLRSMVNIKLITKTSSNTGKSVVLVTTDPSIVKLAALARVPVTRDLQSAPAIPEVAALDEAKTETIATDEDGKAVPEAEVAPESDSNGQESAEEYTPPSREADDASEDDSGAVTPQDDDGGELDAANTDGDNHNHDHKRRAESDSGKAPRFAWLLAHKKLAIAGVILAVALIAVGVWAFVIAPAVKITVKVRTLSQNFSETVAFSRQLTDENVSEGKFYLTEKKLETKNEIEFTATGEKNVGEKASGELIVYAYFKLPGSIPIPEGTSFSIDNLSYISKSKDTLAWDGRSSECTNYGSDDFMLEYLKNGCVIHRVIDVEAVAPGARYNISAANTGWVSSDKSFSAYSEGPMTGGTDDIVTVVQQSDVDKALESLKSADTAEDKSKLFESIGDSNFAIESSFKRETGEPVVKPAVGEKVEDGEKATVSVTTTDTVFTVDKTKVEEFIADTAKLPDGYKIYKINEPFVENFVSTDSGMSGKLKTSLIAGPKITENEVVEMARGKGVGTAQRDIKDNFPGISSVHMETSFPWVTTVPNDTEKITAEIGVEE